MDTSLDFCVSAHKLPCIALVTLTQCNGFREAFLDDVWRECKLLGLLECATLRLLIPSELRGVKVLGGGGTGPLPILVFSEVG